MLLFVEMFAYSDRDIRVSGTSVETPPSVSRTMPDCNSDAQNALIDRARSLMVTYEDMAELIRLGAYRSGSDVAVDEAIQYHDALEGFLSQGKLEAFNLDESYEQLGAILGLPAS